MDNMLRYLQKWPTAVFLTLVAVFTHPGCAKVDERPNVLVVIIDTLRADYLGCYGASTGATPNMDRLAAEGAMFTTCVSSVPVTLPAISTILTSTYPPYHGVRDNGVFTLDRSLVTLAEVFKEAGYATGAVVGAYVIAAGTGIEQGFEYFDSEFGGGYAKESSIEPARAREIAGTQRRASEVTDHAIDWLEKNRGPFFLLAHYFDPHSPYDPPPEFGRRFAESVYLGEVAYTDSQFGRLLDAAKKAAGDSGLIVALVADHGEGLGEHGEEQHGYFIYDSTLRVPFIVTHDGVVPPGIRIEEQSSIADLAPTATKLAGLTIPELWQGISHAGAISGAKPENISERPCYIETYRSRYSYNWSELVGIRHNGWKMIRAPRPELYDLSGDPGEMKNLYESRPEKARSLDTALDDLLAGLKGPFDNLRPAEDLDETKVRKLEALGYVMPNKTRPTGPLPDPKDMVAKLNTRFEATRTAVEAKRLLAQGDSAGAERLLLHALELDPKSSVAHHDLGLLYWDRGDRDEGLRLLEKAAGLSKTSAAPHLNLAITYMTLGRHGDALKEFQVGIVIEPGNTEARYKYGKALETTGNTDGALEQYYKCLEHNPGMRPAQYDAAVLLARDGRYEETKTLLEDLIRKNPSDSYAHAARKMLGRAQ